jgi:hypothetical protein
MYLSKLHLSNWRSYSDANFEFKRPTDRKQLAEVFLGAGKLPLKAKADAAHLAVATVYGVDYLMTWNLRHLAYAVILSRLRPVAEEHGFHLPVVCTPLQLMGNIEYEG